MEPVGIILHIICGQKKGGSTLTDAVLRVFLHACKPSCEFGCDPRRTSLKQSRLDDLAIILDTGDGKTLLLLHHAHRSSIMPSHASGSHFTLLGGVFVVADGEAQQLVFQCRR